MDQLFPYPFRTGIPDIVYLASFLVMCGVIVAVVMVKQNAAHLRRLVMSALLGEYSFLILCTTLLCRQSKKCFGYKIMPLWSYKALYDNEPGFFKWEPFLNISLFIPIGLLLPFVIRDRKWWKVGLCGMCFSLLIEILQPIFERGFCETDDVIHNTLGCLIGYGIYQIVSRCFKPILNV